MLGELVLEALVALLQAVDLLLEVGAPLGLRRPRCRGLDRQLPLEDLARVGALQARIAPLAPLSVAWSYSAMMSALYFSLNRRLVGLGAGSSFPTPTSWTGATRDAVVIVIFYVFLTRPGGIVGYSRCLT